MRLVASTPNSKPVPEAIRALMWTNPAESPNPPSPRPPPNLTRRPSSPIEADDQPESL